MCLDCGCHQWGDCHGDIRHVTLLNICGSVDANNGDLTLQQVAANIVDGLNAMLIDENDDTSKSIHSHTHDGKNYHVHISVEPE